MADDFEYNPDIITVTDDDGCEYAFEVLDRIETENGKYAAVISYYDEPEKQLEDDGEALILKVVEEDDEVYLSQIEDDEEFNEIYDIFDSRLQNLFEESDDDETDEYDEE